ncbi:MAG TPA: VOC family protein [Bacilli bacterium]|nr:VOC family protein [Bacilli bacterium]
MVFHVKPATYVNHVRLNVEDLARSLKYYQEIIGFEVLERTDRTAKLTADGKTTLLSLVQPEGVKPKQPRTTGIYHFALLLPKKKDLANFVIHLSDNNVKAGAGDHLVSEAFYLKDPDGNDIEIYVDRDPNVWDWNKGEVAMTTDPVNIQELLTHRNADETWQGLPKDTVLGHIHLYVDDLKKAEQFYVNGLGFDVVNRFGGQALFLSTEKYHHHIAVNTWQGVGAPRPAENSAGMESYQLIYNDNAAVQATIANLEKVGAKVTEEDGRIMTEDPAGNRVELSY